MIRQKNEKNEKRKKRETRIKTTKDQKNSYDLRFLKSLPVLSAAGIVVLSSMLLLSGCAYLGHSAADNISPKERCQTNDQLYTDLTVSSDQRIYVLPNGQTCPKEVL